MKLYRWRVRVTYGNSRAVKWEGIMKASNIYVLDKILRKRVSPFGAAYKFKIVAMI